jgi:hypothetical protein
MCSINKNKTTNHMFSIIFIKEKKDYFYISHKNRRQWIFLLVIDSELMKYRQ